MGQKLDKSARGAYDAIVYIDGSEVVAEDSNGRKIASGVAGVDDSVILDAALSHGVDVYQSCDLYLTSDLNFPENSFFHSNGSYRLILYNNVRVRFNNYNVMEKISIFLDSTHRGAVFAITSKHDIIFKEFCLDGNYATIGTIVASDKSESYISSSYRIHIIDSVFHDLNGTPINIQTASYDVLVSRCKFYNLLGSTTYGGYSPNTNAGVYISLSTDINISDCVAFLIDDNFVGIVGGKRINVCDNIVNNCRHLAIISDHATAVTCEDICLSNNEVFNAETSILLGYSPLSLPCSGVNIIGGILHNHGTGLAWAQGYGIKFDYLCSNINIIGVDIYSRASAIYSSLAAESCIWIQITNSKIRSNVLAGSAATMVMTSFADCIVSNNIIELVSDSASSGVFYAGRRIIWDGNKFVGVVGNLRSPISTGTSMSNNEFKNCTIEFVGSGSNVVSYNRFIAPSTIYGTVPANTVISHNFGYTTDGCGTSTGTGIEQTIAHGLAAIPTGCKAWIKYLVGARYHKEDIDFDATNIYPTVPLGVAYEWRIE